MTDTCTQVNAFGKALSNPTRYRLLQALLKGRKTVNELTKIVKLSQPAVSQHLKTLKVSQIVVDERRGQEVFYDVNTEHLMYLLANLSKQCGK